MISQRFITLQRNLVGICQHLFLFAVDGVPPACKCNNAKEMIQGKFHQKLKDAACHLKQLEPYTSLSNAAEREIKEIKELKKGAGNKLPRSRAPKCLWDNSLELKTYIRSNAAHEIYKLDGEVPERVMSSDISNISQFCELEWFKWDMFWDETTPFTDDILKLGNYLCFQNRHQSGTDHIDSPRERTSAP